MAEKDLLLGLLSKTLKKTNTEIESLIYEDSGELKENALTVLLDNDADRVSSIKSNYKVDKDEIYGRAKREILSDTEKSLKKSFGVESDKKGEDLYNEIKTKLSKSDSNSNMTDEDVKKHPLYHNLLTSKSSEIEAIKNESALNLQKLQESFTQKEVFTTVNSKAMAMVKGLNPILSEDPVKAQNQLSVITERLKSYQYQINGDNIIVKQDGKVIEDAHGNQIKLNEIVKSISSNYFDFKEGESRNNGTGNNNGGQGMKTATTQDELRVQLSKARTNEERIKIAANYEKNQTVDKV